MASLYVFTAHRDPLRGKFDMVIKKYTEEEVLKDLYAFFQFKYPYKTKEDYIKWWVAMHDAKIQEYTPSVVPSKLIVPSLKPKLVDASQIRIKV